MNLKHTALALLALSAFAAPAAAQMAGNRPMESSRMQPANEPGTPPRDMRTDQRMEQTSGRMAQRGDRMGHGADMQNGRRDMRTDRHHGWNRHHRHCRTVWYHHRRIQRCW